MEALASEYELLCQTYESFNAQSLEIKEWGVTIGVAALIAAYAAKPAERPGRPLVLLAAPAAQPFWITDALWKVVQTGYLARIGEIEAALREERPIAALQSFSTLAASAEGTFTPRAFWEARINPTVFLPHAPIFALGLLLALIYPPKAVSPPAPRGGLRR
ncbi:hypothetical protein [Jannaschia seohaensis]|uniref:Uncharacterized protein n=1 Tax=Jannaschia seohaensis TaxID=475081 RepID=A0A2Y9B6P2_9RHOB|nr:hypothetical protein [Jannaschia seohaensis]PWJ15050.1 hypothetical protein BCF38_11167 [Jannaschia seohaensis]SSA49899.1 hypothetical protein SAMN05421539_11167 [Jannaschia seohaensis]